MLTWNKENLWNYHISLCTGERLKIVISCHLTISLHTHSCNKTLSRISHIQLQHWKLWQQHNAHINSSTMHISTAAQCTYRQHSTLHILTAAHCTYPLSYITGDTDQCFLLSTVVFGSIGNFPKHRWQKTALRFHVDRKTLLFFSLQSITSLYPQNAKRDRLDLGLTLHCRLSWVSHCIVGYCGSHIVGHLNIQISNIFHHITPPLHMINNKKRKLWA